MSLKPPQVFSNQSLRSSNPLELEITAEMAASLGRAGRNLERALEALRETEPHAPDHSTRIWHAADCAYQFLVQRELCGIHNQSDAIAQYGIPKEVTSLLGATQPQQQDKANTNEP